MNFTRRTLLASSLAPLARAVPASNPTRFQIGSLTLPYSAFPLERALEGIVGAGCKYVGFGTAHERKPVLDLEAPPSEAAKLADRMRKMGLTPLMMFATVAVEAPNSVPGHLARVAQASAAGIPYVLTMGSTKPGRRDLWISNLKEIAPKARAAGVTVLIKPHGGNTATGKDCAGIVADVGDPGLKICYDPGNVLDYDNVDPIPDIRACHADVYAYTIKDHRNHPKDQDCGPGFGEIDHYKVLEPVVNTGRDMPLLFENVFEPLLPRPKTPEGIDNLVRRAREFVDTVTQGLLSV